MSVRAGIFFAVFCFCQAIRLADGVGGETEEVVRQVIALTNAERLGRGLRPVVPHATLQEAARWLAHDMAMHQSLNHTDSTGRSMTARLSQFGYTNAHVMAENIALGPATAQEAIGLWMQSSQHRANLLHPDVGEIGVGYAVSPNDGQRYWVQDFGSRFDGS